jgi:hypothetical protein
MVSPNQVRRPANQATEAFTSTCLAKVFLPAIPVPVYLIESFIPWTPTTLWTPTLDHSHDAEIRSTLARGNPHLHPTTPRTRSVLGSDQRGS